MATAPEQLRKRMRTQEAEVSETVRSFFEDSAAASRAYVAAIDAAALKGLEAAFAVQDQGIKASREIIDESLDVTKGLVEAWTVALRQGQAATTKVAASGAKLIEDALSTQ